MTDTMRLPVHNGHLMVAALKRHHDKPVMQLGGTTLTGQQTADRISQYIQAFEQVSTAPSALLAPNRPEVLYILGAGQTQGYRRTSLHPLGSADDHAYVIDDAGITTLIVDPVFTDRAVELLERCPGLDTVLTIGPVPDALAGRAQDLIELAAVCEVRPLTARDLPPDHIVSIAYTGGTTGKPKGVIGTALAMNTMAQIQLAEWEWPVEPRFLMCT
ncbi:MAG: acyl-CoA synthetase, partial [Myxococcales bacterium]